MKHIVFTSIKSAALMIAASALLFSSCGNNGSEEVSTTATDVSTETSEGMVSETTPVKSMEAYFDETIAGNKLTMVDFYAEWCGPCKRMAPFVVEVKEEKKDVVNVMQVDAEAYSEISQRYNLEGYPTIIFFKNGQIVDRALGYMEKDQILQYVDRLK